MTVADIKEFINERIQWCEVVKNNGLELNPEIVKNNFEMILSMLDELDQPIEIDTEKYFEQIDKLVDKEMTQYLKDQIKKALKKEIEKGVNNDSTPTVL